MTLLYILSRHFILFVKGKMQNFPSCFMTYFWDITTVWHGRGSSAQGWMNLLPVYAVISPVFRSFFPDPADPAQEVTYKQRDNGGQYEADKQQPDPVKGRDGSFAWRRCPLIQPV